MTKQFIATICILGLVGMVVGVIIASAQTSSKDVTATVCPEKISITISPSSVNYGTLPLSTTNQAPSPAFVTVTNNGNQNVSLGVRGYDATADPAGTWELCWTGKSPGCTGPTTDGYMHEYSPDDTDWASPAPGGELTTSYQTLATSVSKGDCGGAGGSSKTLYLRIDTPTGTTVYDEYNAQATVLATKI